jgi:hypothetical protein
MPKAKTNALPFQLLVEGRDDEFVCINLFQHYQLQNNFCKIVDCEGFEKLRETFSGRLAQSELKNLGIVVDADLDVTSRWQSITDLLSKEGYQNIPSQPDSQGTIIEQSGKPKVGLWIMPDNSLPGMLENFVAYLVPDPTTNPLWQLTEKCLYEAITFPPNLPQAKARIHTYLAWQNDPGTPLGLAITKKFLDANNPQAGQFINWVRKLFEI